MRDMAGVAMFREMRRKDRERCTDEEIGRMMGVLGKGTEYATEHACGDSAYVMVEIIPEHISGKVRKNEFNRI